MVSAAVGHGMTHGLELAFAALLTYIGVTFGADLAVLGTVATIGTFTFGATAPPAGFLSDRYGPRAVIAGCMFAAAIFAFAVAASPSLPVLAVALALLGAAIGFYHPAGTAMVSTVTKRRGMAFAAHGIAGNVGVALAPVVSIGIAIAVDWRAAYVVLGAMALATALLVWRIAPGPEAAREQRRMADAQTTAGGASQPRTAPPLTRSWLAPALLLVYTVAIGMGFIYRGALTFMATHIEANLGFTLFGWSTSALTGALTTIVLLFALLGQVVGGTLSDRMPVERAAVPITLGAFPLLALGGMTGGVVMLVALAGFVVMNFAQQPIINGLIADYAPQGARGKAYGISFFLTFGVGSIAGSIGGFVAQAFGTSGAFVMLAFVGVGIAVLALAIAMGAEKRRGEVTPVGVVAE